jgi:hypothetical protein
VWNPEEGAELLLSWRCETVDQELEAEQNSEMYIYMYLD